MTIHRESALFIGLSPAEAEELANQMLADELDEPHDILGYDE